MEELNLLKKHKKGLLSIVFSRTGIVLLLLLLGIICFFDSGNAFCGTDL